MQSYTGMLYIIIYLYVGALPSSENFILKSQTKSITEQFIEKCETTRYPSNVTLLKSINSNCEQQFDKVSQVIQYKIDVLNNEMQKKFERLATRDDIAQTQKQQYPKDYERRIESLKRLLHRQQAIHEDNNEMLKLLQDNIHYQNNVLFSVFVCFVLAILALCLYNVLYVFLIVFICFQLYVLNLAFFHTHDK